MMAPNENCLVWTSMWIWSHFGGHFSCRTLPRDQNNLKHSMTYWLLIFLTIKMQLKGQNGVTLTSMFLHGLVGLSHEGFRVCGHITEPSDPVKIFGKLVSQVFKMFVGWFVVRINHPDSTGVDQLWRQRLHLILKSNKLDCFAEKH